MVCIIYPKASLFSLLVTMDSCMFSFLYACVTCPNITMIVCPEAASCLERAVNIFCEIGRLNMAARYYKVSCVSFEHALDVTHLVTDTELY